MAIDTAFKNPEVEDDSRGSLKEEAIASESASHDVSSKSYRNLVHRIDRRVCRLV
jgi:hypothetical protein